MYSFDVFDDAYDKIFFIDFSLELGKLAQKLAQKINVQNIKQIAKLGVSKREGHKNPPATVHQRRGETHGPCIADLWRSGVIVSALYRNEGVRRKEIG